MTTTTNERDGCGTADRRAVLGLITAGAAALAAGAAAAAEHEHHHGQHGEHQHHGPRHQRVVDAALACVNRGEVCIDHCIGLLSSGDTSLKDCIRTVSAMLPMCAALARLAALDARRLKDLARVCIDVCADCETECKRHAEHHTACKACAESCAECIRVCKALLDA